MMDKIERDGMVAVLVSPGYGAGWSTWNDDEHRAVLCMDADIVQAVLDGDHNKAAEIAVQKCNILYTGGANQLVVEWVKKGAVFEIDEYDGYEALYVIGGRDYMVA